ADDDEEEEDADASSMVAEMYNTLLSEEQSYLVPEKKRKKEATVAKRDTVVKPKKEVTVAKEGMDTAVDEPKKAGAAKKNPLLEAAKAAEAGMVAVRPEMKVTRVATKQPRRGAGLVMQRVVSEELDAFPEPMQLEFDSDDAFADEFREFRKNDPGEMERSLSVIEQYEAGLLSIEDIGPDDLYLTELISPCNSPRTPRIETPRVDAALRMSRPLVLGSGKRDRKGSRGKSRIALDKVKRGLFNDSEDENASPDTPTRFDSATRFRFPEPDQKKRMAFLKKSKHIRNLFEAARRSVRADEVYKRRPQIMERTKIQYPGIAPLPETPKSSRHHRLEDTLKGVDGIM
ncbi:hypothetical protein PMAYCL1PPCAC_10165, partial [Pristionchus mayeri]